MSPHVSPFMKQIFRYTLKALNEKSESYEEMTTVLSSDYCVYSIFIKLFHVFHSFELCLKIISI
jgi:hypothetical protein